MENSGRYVIREITRKEIPDVLKLEKTAFPDPWPEIIFLDVFRNQHAFLGAFDSGRLIAFLVAFYGLDHIHLANLAVIPDARCKGVGSLLLERVKQLTLEARLKIIILEVRVSNYPAIQLYQKMNFTPVGSLPEYYEDKEDAVVFYWEHNGNGELVK